MSLTSYRAAPPRVTVWAAWGSPEAFCRRFGLGAEAVAGCSTPPAPVGCLEQPRYGPPWQRDLARRDAKRALMGALLTGPVPLARQALDDVNGFLPYPPALMPGDDLLFQRLSVSTIGAVRFHGRVRDGIGWVTDAMVTKQ